MKVVITYLRFLLIVLLPNVLILKDIDEVKKNMDIVFIVDNTGSMSSEINIVKEKLNDIILEIERMEQLNGTVNYGAIAYKDYGENFLTLSHDLSPDKNLIKNFVNKMESEGGGDEPEALAEALNKANRLTWREDAIKIIILIADAPPHSRLPHSKLNTILKNDKINYHVYGRINPLPYEQEIEALVEKNIVIHCILVRNNLSTKSIMNKISMETRGIITHLKNYEIIPKFIKAIAIEGLDRLNFISILNKKISENIGILNNVLAGQQKEFLMEKMNNVKITRLQFDNSNDNIDIVYQDIDISDIIYALKYIHKTTCKEYNVFCDLSSVLAPVSGINGLNLESFKVKISISDHLSKTCVFQKFENNKNNTFSGDYVFPLPLDASIYYMQALVNNEILNFSVFTTEKAQGIYEIAAKNKNNTVSLLTQQTNNAFKINIGNIAANSAAEINICFASELKSSFDILEYFFPVNNFEVKTENKIEMELELEVVSSDTITEVEIINSEKKIEFNSNKINLKETITLDKEFILKIRSNSYLPLNKKNKAHFSFFSKEKLPNNANEYYSLLFDINESISSISFTDKQSLLLDIQEIYIYIDQSKSIVNLKSQYLELLKKLLNEINLKTRNSKVYLVFFNENKDIYNKIEVSQETNQLDLDNYFNESNYLARSCLSEPLNYFSCKNNSRIFILSDFDVSNKLDIIDSLDFCYYSNKNFKVIPISLSYTPNHEFLSEITMRTKTDKLSISPLELNKIDLNNFIDNVFSNRIDFSFSIILENEILYDSNSPDFDKFVFCSDYTHSNFIEESLKFSCLFDKSKFDSSQIYNKLNLKVSYNDDSSLFNIKELLENNEYPNKLREDFVHYISASKVIKYFEKIYNDLNFFEISPSLLKSKKEESNTDFEVENQSRGKPKNGKFNLLMSDLKKYIENLGTSFNLITKFTSFLAIKEEDLKIAEKQYEKHLSDKKYEKEEILLGDYLEKDMDKEKINPHYEKAYYSFKVDRAKHESLSDHKVREIKMHGDDPIISYDEDEDEEFFRESEYAAMIIIDDYKEKEISSEKEEEVKSTKEIEVEIIKDLKVERIEEKKLSENDSKLTDLINLNENFTESKLSLSKVIWYIMIFIFMFIGIFIFMKKTFKAKSA